MNLREELARLRGQIYVPEPEPIAPPQATLNVAEVQTMIDMAVRATEGRLIGTFEQMLAEREPERALLVTIMELQRKIDLLDAQVNSDMAPCQRIPDLASITKLRAQIWHNTGKGIPSRQLKIAVWTCDKAKTSRYKEGTCGNFYVPVYPPGRVVRKRLGDSLDYLKVDDAKLIGCVLDKKYGSKKFPDQAAIIMPDHRLYLQLGSERIDCGIMQPAGDDWAADAPKGTWWWPDSR